MFNTRFGVIRGGVGVGGVVIVVIIGMVIVDAFCSLFFTLGCILHRFLHMFKLSVFWAEHSDSYRELNRIGNKQA